MLYLISANVIHHDGTWQISSQVPTFLLNSHVQGIVDASHAERIARDVINPLKLEGIEIHMTVIEIDD